MSKKSNPPVLSDARLAELGTVMVDEHAVLGPLDRTDLVEALNELLQRRKQAEALEQSAPTVAAA